MCYWDSRDHLANIDRFGSLERIEEIAHQVGDGYVFGTRPPGEGARRSDRERAWGHDCGSGHGGGARTDGGARARGPPAPRYPSRQREHTVEDLLPHAREIVTKESSIDQIESAPVIGNNSPGYNISEGERVLFVVSTKYDDVVIETFTRAIREEGARVDVIDLDLRHTDQEIDPWYDELPGLYVPEGFEGEMIRLTSTPAERTWEQGAEPTEPPLLWWEEVATGNVPDRLVPEYDLLIWGPGGPIAEDQLEHHRYERIPWQRAETLQTGYGSFPKELWNAIDEKTTEMIRRAETVRLTDPEGTDLTFTNHFDDDGEYVPRGFPGHIFGHRTWPKEETDTTGVVAGTLNHVNAFPHVEVEVEDGKVVEVRGGGEYGELWREALEVTEQYQYHKYPGSGLFWLWEMAIGTNPKMVRPSSRDLSTVNFTANERFRSGVIHVGFGTPTASEIERRAAESGKPWGHVHVHLLFATYEATTADGETYTVIDDGHLTALDDPEVREVAAKYGDPDELLSEDWIPGVPGVNEDGDYHEDYASDPLDWLNEERERFYA
jgi:hypothetical protein